MFDQSKKATRITLDQAAQIAAQGVERALQARQAAGIELTAEQTEQIRGGLLLLKDPIIAGGIRPVAALLKPIGAISPVGNLNLGAGGFLGL